MGGAELRFEPSRRMALGLCAGIVCVAAAARALPLPGELWLDEIWSWSLARDLASPLDVFTAIHHSNNHHLYTLIFYALGEDAGGLAYRAPSWLAGSAAVALAAALAGRVGRLEAVLAAFLCGASFSLLHFASEARGYSLVVCCALAAHAVLQRDLARPRIHTALAFGALCVAGFLSQLVFGFYYAGALAQSARRLLARATPGRAALQLARLHAVPLIALLGLHAVDLRHWTLGTGPQLAADVVLARGVGYALGLPVARELGYVYGLGAGLLLALGLRRMWRRGDDAALAFAVSIVLAPAAALLALDPDVVAVRYFLIGTALFLLLLAELAAAALRRGGAARLGAVALLAVFAVGNVARAVDFARLGRGGFERALDYMAAHTAAPVVDVAGDSDFRIPMILGFHARGLPPQRRLVYHPRDARPAGGPPWLLRHAGRRPRPLPRALRDLRGEPYVLVAEFDHAAISGFWCGLYRHGAAVSRVPGGRPAPVAE